MAHDQADQTSGTRATPPIQEVTLDTKDDRRSSISSNLTTESIASDPSTSTEKRSILRRGIDAIKNSYIGQKTAPVFSKIAAAGKWAANTKVGKFVGKVVRSEAFSIVVSLVSTLVGLSGVTGPASPVLIGLGVTGLGVTGGAIALQVRKTRKHRHLAKEGGLLIENRLALMQQQKLLEEHPDLKEALQDSLYISKHEQKQSQPIKPETILASHAGQNLIKLIPELLETISSVLHTMHNPIAGIPLAIAAGKTIYSAIEGTHDTKESTEITKSLHDYINEEKDKEEVGSYKNVQELRDMMTRNTIQAQATQALVENIQDRKDKGKPDLTPQEKQQQFNIHSTAFAELIKKKEYQKADDQTKEKMLTEETSLHSHHSSIYGQSMLHTPKTVTIQSPPSNPFKNLGQDTKRTLFQPFMGHVIPKSLLSDIDKIRNDPHPNIHLDRPKSAPAIPQPIRKSSNRAHSIE